MSLDYLSKLRRDAFAMIHQLGPPTFSMTFTGAKSKWTTLMFALHTLNKNHMEIPKFLMNLNLNILQILLGLIQLHVHVIMIIVHVIMIIEWLHFLTF